jgi:hypothetical protein
MVELILCDCEQAYSWRDRNIEEKRREQVSLQIENREPSDMYKRTERKGMEKRMITMYEGKNRGFFLGKSSAQL